MPLPSVCQDQSKTIYNASWVGIENAVGNWNVDFQNPATPEACCALCYTATPRGCDAWVFDAGASPTRCTIILGWHGVQPDQQCPSGHTDGTHIRVGDGGQQIAGPGPCGGEVILEGAAGKPGRPRRSHTEGLGGAM